MKGCVGTARWISPQKRSSIQCIDMLGVLSLEIRGQEGEVRHQCGTPNRIGKELGHGECLYLVTLKDRDAMVVTNPKRAIAYVYLWHKGKLVVKPLSLLWGDAQVDLQARR